MNALDNAAARSHVNRMCLNAKVPLIESGIQIHTLSPKNFISIDVYSCKKFGIDTVASFARDYFSAEKVEQNFIIRGVEYGNY